MATQLQSVTRNPRMKQDQVASMNARMSMLPEMLRQRERSADLDMQKNQFNRTMGFKRRQQDAAERAQQAGMGLEAAKLGMTASMSGNTTLGQVPYLNKLTGTGSTGLAGIRTGDIVGSGLAGFGASQLLGGKSKLKKGLVGAGAGGLLSMLSGGNMMAGATSGGLGSIMGSMFK